jgi:hypothetical protein
MYHTSQNVRQNCRTFVLQWSGKETMNCNHNKKRMSWSK